MGELLYLYAEAPLCNIPPRPADGHGVDQESLFYDGTRPIPFLTPEVFTELLGIACLSGSAEGAQCLQDHADAYYAILQDGAADGLFDPRDTMERIVSTQGAIEGAGVGTAMAQARRADASTGKFLGGIHTALDLAAAASGGGVLVDLGVSATLGAAFDQLDDQSASTYEDLLRDYADQRSANRDLARARIIIYIGAFHDELIASGAIDGSPKSIDELAGDLLALWWPQFGLATLDTQVEDH